MYTDPYSDFGRLGMELWRACRLVVDTGIHDKRWSREEAIAYLSENTPNPDGDIEIRVVGLRPGEKLYEEVFHGGEPLVSTDCAGILLAAPRTADITALTEAIAQLKAQCFAFDTDGALTTIQDLVPEFSGNRNDARTAASA